MAGYKSKATFQHLRIHPLQLYSFHMSNSSGMILHLRFLLLLCLLVSCSALPSVDTLDKTPAQRVTDHPTTAAAGTGTKENSDLSPVGRYDKILDMCYSYLESNLCEGEDVEHTCHDILTLSDSVIPLSPSATD